MADKKTKITTDTTRIVSDRLAKIASTYTNGYTTVQYCGSRVATDVKGTIFLPSSLRDLKPEDESLAWGYVSHEMGHQGVENDLKVIRKMRKKVSVSTAVRALVPEELTEIAPVDGVKVFTTTAEFLDKLEDYGRVIVDKMNPEAEWRYGAIQSAAAQLRTLVNVFEDPRMENQVGRRWAGSKEYLAKGNVIAKKNWAEKAQELIDSGADRSFDIFSIGLVFAVGGEDIDLGPVVKAQIEACRDIIEVFKAEADWNTSHGFFDSWNAALACLGRVYRSEVPTPPPAPTCPECGSENLRGTLRRPNVATLICLDCGHREESEVEVGEAPTPFDNPENGTIEYDSDEETPETDEAPETDETDESGDGETSDGENPEGESSDGENTEGETSDGETSEGETSEGETSEGGEAPEGGEADDPSKGGNGPSLEPGMIIRLKADGSRAKILSINPDGSVVAVAV